MKTKSYLLKLFVLAVVMMLGGLQSWAADIIASGTVTDESEEPLIGVSVVAKGHTGLGAVTDIDGNFKLKVPDGTTLVVSYVGYNTKELKAAPNMKVVLESSMTNLDEVVVIGYGQVKRKDLTTAVSTVGEEALANRPIVSAAQAIQGKALRCGCAAAHRRARRRHDSACARYHIIQRLKRASVCGGRCASRQCELPLTRRYRKHADSERCLIGCNLRFARC